MGGKESASISGDVQLRTIKIGDRPVGENHKTFFVAEVGSNHGGDLELAKHLMGLARASGADAVKFQHFQAPRIVSDFGFKKLTVKQSHQSTWKKSVFEMYLDASTPWGWTQALVGHAKTVGIDLFSTPYDLDAVDFLDTYIPAFKIGSGDINWPAMLIAVARKGKPVFLATGASDIGEVQRAVDTIRVYNDQLVLMQCNTNYTGEAGNMAFVNLNVLKTYQAMYPDVILGLSDHAAGHSAVLGAVALGAKVIEKHFTDDKTRDGPDHHFAMSPDEFREMVDRTRELEYALGSSVKKVESNEYFTAIVQRRCLRASRDLKANSLVTWDCITELRPSPYGSIPPDRVDAVVGRVLRVDVPEGEHFNWGMFGNQE